MANKINTWAPPSLPPLLDLELSLPAPIPVQYGSEGDTPRFQAIPSPEMDSTRFSEFLSLIGAGQDREEEKMESKAISGPINSQWIRLATSSPPDTKKEWDSNFTAAVIDLMIGTDDEKESWHAISSYEKLNNEALSTLNEFSKTRYLKPSLYRLKQSLVCYQEKYDNRKVIISKLIHSIGDEITKRTFNQKKLDQHIVTLQAMLKEMNGDLERAKLRKNEIADRYLAPGPNNVFTQQRASNEPTIAIPNFFIGKPYSFPRDDDWEDKMTVIQDFYRAYSAVLFSFKFYIGKCIARTQELTHYLENGRRFYPQN